MATPEDPFAGLEDVEARCDSYVLSEARKFAWYDISTELARIHAETLTSLANQQAVFSVPVPGVNRLGLVGYIAGSSPNAYRVIVNDFSYGLDESYGLQESVTIQDFLIEPTLGKLAVKTGECTRKLEQPWAGSEWRGPVIERVIAEGSQQKSVARVTTGELYVSPKIAWGLAERFMPKKRRQASQATQENYAFWLKDILPTFNLSTFDKDVSVDD